MAKIRWSIFSPENSEILAEVKLIASLSEDDIVDIKKEVEQVKKISSRVKRQAWTSWALAMHTLQDLDISIRTIHVRHKKLVGTSSGEFPFSHKRSTIKAMLANFKNYMSSQDLEEAEFKSLVFFSNIQKDGLAKVYIARGTKEKKKFSPLRIRISEGISSPHIGDICLTEPLKEDKKEVGKGSGLKSLGKVSQVLTNVNADVQYIACSDKEQDSFIYRVPEVLYRPCYVPC